MTEPERPKKVTIVPSAAPPIEEWRHHVANIERQITAILVAWERGDYPTARAAAEAVIYSGERIRDDAWRRVRAP